MAEGRRKFQINPGPLKMVPARRRAAHLTEYEASQAIRCQARTQDGTRCLRDSQPGADYCWQHAGRS